MSPDRFCFIIPARGGSKRLPRKNVLPLLGRPILTYTIEAALESGITDRIVLSTDDEEIAAIGESYSIEIHWRSAALSTDTSRMQHVCAAVIADQRERQELDGFCCLVPTAPLRSCEDIREAWEIIKRDDVDFVMGAAEFHCTPWQAMSEQDGYARLMWPQYRDTKSQHMPPTFADNASMYWAKTGPFLKEDTFFGHRLKPYLMSKLKSVDVDTEEDFLLLESLMTIHAQGETTLA